jgi:hypothetical protein
MRSGSALVNSMTVMGNMPPLKVNAMLALSILRLIAGLRRG